MNTTIEHETTWAELTSAPPPGEYDGHLVRLAPLGMLPRPLERALTSVLAWGAALVWSGKRLEADRGVNLWLGRRVRLVPFGVTTTGSVFYDVPENPRPLRPIRAELVATPDGVLRGRMSYGRSRRTLLEYELVPRRA